MYCISGKQPKTGLERRPQWGLELNSKADGKLGQNKFWDRYGRPASHGIWHGSVALLTRNGHEWARAKQQFGRIGHGGGFNGQPGKGTRENEMEKYKQEQAEKQKKKGGGSTDRKSD